MRYFLGFLVAFLLILGVLQLFKAPQESLQEGEIHKHDTFFDDFAHAFTHSDEEEFVCYRKGHRSFYSTMIFLTLASATLAFYGYKTNKDKNALLLQKNAEIEKQKDEIAEQKHEIEQQNSNLALKNNEIEHKNEKITASIQYAKRIQQAILPTSEYLQGVLQEHFVFYRPKDIVSGDFYFVTEIDNKLILAAVDCTGHGVPGAFMSMIGNDVLTEIINEKTVVEADKILNRMHLQIRKTLQQNTNENRDGMDVALVVLHKNSSNTTFEKLEYAGAKNSLYYVQNGSLTEIKGDRNSIGGHQHEEERIFNKFELNIDQPTTFYICSDGVIDQFGGADNRKLGAKKFRELLQGLATLPMHKQENYFANHMTQWQGKHTQTDDMLLLGVNLVG
jgi:serine phosphatase RsbU (regulator of sigma subunit)